MYEAIHTNNGNENMLTAMNFNYGIWYGMCMIVH